MGFNLWDIGAFATGAIERDREITKENLLIRADELKAKRDSLIKRKDKKYDMEIKAYYKEKDKADKINGLIAEAKAFNEANKGKKDADGKDIVFDKNLFATKYLMASMGVQEFNALTDTQKTNRINDLIRSEGNWGSGYQMKSKDPDAIAALQSKEEDIIFKNYSNELAKAKDDSFLINKILGKSTNQTPTKDLEEAVNAEVKASEVVKKIDDATKTDGETDTLQLSEGIVKISVPKDYEKAFDTHRKDLVFKSVSDKENAIDFLTTSKWLNADGAGYYKIDDTGKVIKSTANGKALMKTYQDTYNHVLNSMKDSTYYAMDKSIGNIGANFNSTEIHNITQNLLRTRGVNMDKTGWFDGKKDMKVIAMVPVNILDTSNKIDFGEGAIQVDSQKVRAKYEEFLRLVAKEEKFQSQLVGQLENHADKVMAVQQDLEDNGPYTDTFKTWLKDQDIYLKEEDKVTEGKDGKVTETTKVEEEKLDDGTKVKTDKISSETWGVMKNGDKGVIINGRLYSIKDNLEYLKTINDPTIKSHVDEAIKFGFNVNTIGSIPPSKYLTTETSMRGVKKYNPSWKKIQDLQKKLTEDNKKTKSIKATKGKRGNTG